MSDRVYLFDTTLRDGEQSPGASMNVNEKLRIASRLEELGVDIIEAGFPAASKGDLEAVSAVAQKLTLPEIAGLARTNKEDIDKAWAAVSNAKKPRLHVFIATSDIHMQYKLRLPREQVIASAVAGVKYAKSFTDSVEFSAEDASRSDRDFLCKIIEAAVEAGATVINIPDTVGYAIPDEFAELIRYVKDHTPNIHKAIISVHCHNDLGLATANTLSAIHVPGHSPGSLVFMTESDGKKVLFGQDVHGPLAPDLKSNRKDYLASLEKLVSMDVDILCEGHFGIFWGKDTIRQFIQSFM
mgnify:CR=1 FL=1